MDDNYTIVGRTLEVADLGSSVLKAAKRHSKSFGSVSLNDSCALQPRGIKDYVHVIEASRTEIRSTTEVLKLAAVQLDFEQFGKWSSDGGNKTASRALELSKNTFNAMREQFLKDSDQVTGCTSYLIARRCDDAADKLALLNKDLERASTSLLLMLAVLKLKRDTSSSDDDTCVRLQRLQVQSLAAKMQDIGLGDLESTHDCASEAGSIVTKSDATSTMSDPGVFVRCTPGTTPDPLQSDCLGTTKNRGDHEKASRSYSWSKPENDYVPQRDGSVVSIASSSASSDTSRSIFRSTPPHASQPTDSAEVNTLLLQAAQSASSLAHELVTETHSWYKSHRLNSNALRGSLEMVKSRVEGLLGTFEQCKGELYFTPVSQLGPTVITDIVDCIPSNVRGPSPPVKDRKPSWKKIQKQRYRKSKKTKKTLAEPASMIMKPADPMAQFPAPPMPPPPPGMSDPFRDPFSGWNPESWDLPPAPVTGKGKKGKKSKKNVAPDVPLRLPTPPPPPAPVTSAMPCDDPFSGMMPPGLASPNPLNSLPDPFANLIIGKSQLRKKSRKAKVKSVKDDVSEDGASSDSDTIDYRSTKKEDVVAELLEEWTRSDGGSTTSGEDI